MTVQAKICGLSTSDAVDAAVSGGAAFVGFVFYPPSPRNISPDVAAALAARVPSDVAKVGVFVDPSDAELDAVFDKVKLDMIQLHGDETPDRVRHIAAQRGCAVIKAIPVQESADIAHAWNFEDSADYLLFDAKPPADMPDALPGGNGITFDPALVRGEAMRLPWILSGGLEVDNVAAAVRISGATLVDVSSGVESAPGKKDVAKIAAFLTAVGALGLKDAKGDAA